MTHLALPEEWSFRGVDLSTFAYAVKSADAEGLPNLRGNNVVVPSVDGERFARKRPGAKRIPLAMWVFPTAADGTVVEPTEREQARANLDALLAILGDRSQGTLVRTMPDGSTRSALAEVVDIGSVQDQHDHQLIGLVADFELADPYLYGADVIDAARAIPASPTDFALINPGSASGNRLVLDFTGPIANPRIANLTLDPGGSFYVECLVTVAPGAHLVIDCGAWTADNAGVNAIGSIRHSGAFEFLRLAPGSNSLRVTATSPGGTLTTTFTPPYI